ncbi:MAG: HDOD domain-containing protein [Spirochaetes bacterium]|nr:HDOD domain-containing protein [Spirochaetota bacterium]
MSQVRISEEESGLSSGEDKHYTIHPTDYKTAIASEADFYIQFHTLNAETEGAIIKSIHRYLENYDLSYIKNQIINIIKELVNNAIKANLKRIFFKLKGLDIDKTEDYRAGMESFKEEAYEGTEDYLGKLETSNLVVRISFKSTEEYLYINVINNVPILDTEISKINARIKKAYKYKDIAEAFEEVLDESEGAGLGLIMALMIFKNIGMPPEAFRIYRKGELTIAAIAIPQNMDRIRSRVQIAEEILKEIKEIPAFPDNILHIQKLCANPDATIKEIASAISMDPGLTTSILKLANSAGYFTVKKTETIEDAVKIIGVKGINTLLLATGVYKVLDARYKRSESVWKDSYKRAAYAQKILIQMNRTRATELTYLSALLSDIGYIVMFSLKSSILKKLQNIAGFKGMDDSNLLEEISLGLSHSTLGGMIFSKWNFNETLVKTIEYHHRPHLAPENLKQTIYTVYLADCLVEMDKNRTRYEFIDEDVLKYFNLTERKSFEILHKTLRESYENQEQ